MVKESTKTVALEYLRQNPVFRRLTTEEMKMIIDLSETETYGAGDVVFVQGDPAKKLFFVEKGRVGISLQPTSTRQVTVTTEYQGGVFGWSALMPPQIYTASARCFDDCELLAVDGAKLRELCYREPTIGVKAMEGLALLIAGRLDNARLQLLDMFK